MRVVGLIGFAMLFSACLSPSSRYQSYPAGVTEAVVVDRSPISFGEFGLYSGFPPISPAHYGDLSYNILPPERAIAEQTPWDFYIIQYNEPEEFPGEEGLSLLRQMAENGKRIILRVRLGRWEPHPDVDAMERSLIALFEHVDPDWVFAITLDEENVYWYGWSEALTELYYRAKSRWPDVQVYQWWSPMEVPRVHRERGWVALPADGWIINLYGKGRDAFERKLVAALETDRPVIHIAWASPTWLRWSGADAWEPDGLRILKDQIEVCREYDVPVAFFAAQPPTYDSMGRRLQGILWAWAATDPGVREFFVYLESLVARMAPHAAD